MAGTLLPSEWAEAAAQVAPAALSDWLSGARDSAHCESLEQLVEEMPAHVVTQTHKALSAAARSAEPSWRELDAAGVNKNVFLALVTVLMNHGNADVAGTAAAVYMAALRCSGAVGHGVLHPMVAFELSRTLRTVLCGATSPARLNGSKASAAGRKRSKPDANDDWDEDRPLIKSATSAAVATTTRELLVSELELLLKAVPLSSHPDVLSSLVSALVAVATADFVPAKASGRGTPKGNFEGRTFDLLSLCLRPEHGEVARTAPLIFRSLVPHLALDSAPSSPSIPKEMIGAQSACVDFVLRIAPPRSTADADLTDDDASLLSSILTLLQRTSVASLERAEPRAYVCSALSRLVAGLAPSVCCRFARFLWRYGHTAKIGARTFATEMAAAILTLGASHADAQEVLLAGEDTVQTCWRLVLQRLDDRAAGVRAKAVGCLAGLIEALHAKENEAFLAAVQHPLMLSVFTPGTLSSATPSAPTRSDDGGDRRLSLLSVAGSCSAATPNHGSRNSPFTPAEGRGGSSPSASLIDAAKLEANISALGPRLQERCADERPAVRRVALQALEAWGVASGVGLSRSQLQLICERCQDSSPSIRKQAARSLTALLQHDPTSAVARQVWLEGVLPLSRDAETSVSDAAVDAIEEIIVEPLAAHRAGSVPVSTTNDDDPFWLLLASIRPQSLPHLQQAIAVLSARSRLPSQLATIVLSLLSCDIRPVSSGDVRYARDALWAILLELAQKAPKNGRKEPVDVSRLLTLWRDSTHTADVTGALRVILCISKRGGLPDKSAAELFAELLGQVRKREGTPETVALVTQTACALGGLGKSDKWVTELRESCAATICDAEKRSDMGPAFLRELHLALVVYGELTLALSLASPGAKFSAPTSAVVAAATHLAKGQCDPAVSASAFVALGKFCLGSPALADRLLPMFMRELSSNTQPAVRNNALIVLFDLVKAHTALFDRHLPTIALAVTDPSPLVRHHAVVLLTQLLLEDYIKWRPSLLRAFCVALVDHEPTLREMARSCLFDMLLPRSPLLAFNSFVPLLFQLNGCLEHPQHSTPLPADERASYEMVGSERQPHRLNILRGLLASMADEHKLQVTAKLCHEVLAPVLDGQMRLEPAHDVLADSLRLLACKEAKVSNASGGGGADDAEERPMQGTASSAAAAAKGKVLTVVARKATVESIVPIVIELKRYLEKYRSPLLRDVFLFLRELLRDHKAHLNEILSRDKQLAAEVEYDMRQLASDHASTRAFASITPANGRRSSTGSMNGRRINSGVRTPGKSAESIRGRRESDSISAHAVPTPDRLRGSMAIPKLRSKRTSLIGSGGSNKPLGTSRPMGSAVNRGVAPFQKATKGVSAGEVLRSPFKEPMPARQWNVCPSPLAQGVFDAVA